MTIEKPFFYQDEIALTVPSNFITNNQIQITSSNFLNFITSVNGNLVTLSSFPSSPQTVAANNIITFFITNANNFESVEPQTISIAFYRNGNKYQEGSTTYSAT